MRVRIGRLAGMTWLAACAGLGCNQYDSSAPPPAVEGGGAGETSQHADFGNADAGQGQGPQPGSNLANAIAPSSNLPSSNSGNAPASVRGSLVSEFLAAANDDWLVLIEADWELDAGSEAHLCARATAPRDVYLHEFAPLIPRGTHHTVLTVMPSAGGPDGATACSTPNVNGHEIYASGVGTEPNTLPDGVAMRVRAGEQMLLDLHLFNAGSEMLSGRSGVLVKTMDEAAVDNVAEWILGGPLSLNIPVGHAVQSGQCTFDEDATIFAVGPHMHQLGVHMKITAQSSVSGSSVLFDAPYNFDSQQKYAVDFVEMKVGDVVRLECTYENTTGHPVSWGQSTLDEMCFVGLMRFPAGTSGSYLCMN